MSDPISNFSELLSNPLGDLISSIGKGVGEAQAALDAGSLNATLDIYREDNASERTPDEQRMLDLIREIGYQPTFYVLPETEVEAQISISMTLNSNPASPLTPTLASRFSMIATPLNAGNVNRFHINSNAVAKLKFKIVPVPPPAAITEMRVVPNLIGKVFNDATTTLIAQLGFTYKVEGTLTAGTIATQSPAAQEIVRAATEIVLTLE
jgi:hypothetical protein